jgi:hypothetical protein
MNHRFVPRPLAIDEEEHPAIWDCRLRRVTPGSDAALTDNCKRIELLEPESA